MVEMVLHGTSAKSYIGFNSDHSGSQLKSVSGNWDERENKWIVFEP